MKRWAVRICLFLLLGAIVNVAVGWGCLLLPQSLTSRVFKGQDWIEIEAPAAEVARFREAFPSTLCEDNEILFGGSRRLGLLTSEARLFPLDSPGTTLGPSVVSERSIHRVACGFPTLAVEGFECWTGDYLSRTGGLSVPDIAAKWMIQTRWTDLPFHPIWPGFAINTVFYAVVLWGLFAGPLVVRRRRRIRRGLCPKCAYDLRGSVGAAACPECGASR